MTDKTEVILITETVAKSWARSAGTWASCMAMILPGWWIGSTALTITGVIIFWITIFAWASGLREKGRMTIAQARAKLDEIEARR